MMTRYDYRTIRGPLAQDARQPISRNGYAVKALAIATIILLTQVYRVVALFDIRASYFSVSIVFLISVLSLFFSKVIISLLKSETFITYIFLFCFAPIFSAIFIDNFFSLEIYFRYISYMAILISGFIIGSTLHSRSINNIILYSIIIVSFSAFLSLLYPNIFFPMALDAGANVNYEQRAFGFFLQPNSLSVCLIFIYSCYGLGIDKKFKEYFVFFLVLGTVLISGSRFGLMLVLILQFFRVSLAGYRNGSSGNFLARAFSITTLFLFLYLLSLLIAQFLVNSMSSIGGLGDRLLNLMQFRLEHSGDLGEINSLNLRLQHQEFYLELIRNDLLWGHGFGFEKMSLGSGQIDLAAHSTVLSLALDFGALYVVVFILAAFLPFRKILLERREVVHEYIHFILIFILATCAYHGALENGVVTFALGLLLAKIYRTRPLSEEMVRPIQGAIR